MFRKFGHLYFEINCPAFQLTRELIDSSDEGSSVSRNIAYLIREYKGYILQKIEIPESVHSAEESFK